MHTRKMEGKSQLENDRKFCHNEAFQQFLCSFKSGMKSSFYYDKIQNKLYSQQT